MSLKFNERPSADADVKNPNGDNDNKNNNNNNNMPRRDGIRRLASIEDSVDASIQLLKDNIQKREGRLIATTRNNTIRGPAERQQPENKNGKKNNSMNVLSD